MDLLCRIGRHRRAGTPPVWNNGYWFSNCTRCGCELVRRGGGRWHVPRKGYRVVWKTRPASTKAAKPAPEEHKAPDQA
jgi:hypothetical protein